MTDDTPVLRTDFADDSAWAALCSSMREPTGDFRAYVTSVSDPAYADATVEKLVPLASAAGHRFLVIADRVTMNDPERPLLVVDLVTEPGRTFRVTPSALWGVENNLSIANMDFRDFADAVDADGVFRGFA